MATATASEPAVEISRAIFALMTSERPPRFPRVASEFGLSPGGLKTLLLLEPGTELQMGELADQLYCDASNMTGIVDRLEQRGLIERRQDPDDRRVKRIAVTTAGEGFREELMARLYEPLDAVTALGVAEQRQLRDLLHRALEHVD